MSDYPVHPDLSEPVHHLPEDMKQKDAENRAALMRMYPHYAARAAFTVRRGFWWHDPVHKRNVYRDQTVMVISFAAERAKDQTPADVRQDPLWGQVAEDNETPGG